MGPDLRCLLLLVLSLLGGSSGFPAGIEYQYRYSGRVVTGIPGLKHQFAAAGLQADVTLQVTQDGRTLIELRNVEVGSFHDEIYCDLSALLPLEYHPLRDDVLLQPFTLHLNGSQPGYMETPPEPAWAINIRKAVANIINIPPLQGHKIVQPTFMVVEDHMAGRCHTWYTLLKLPQYQAMMENKQQESLIEEDVQRQASAASYTTSKTRGRKHGPGAGSKGRAKGRPAAALTSSTPALSQDLWDLTSTVRFDICFGGFSLKESGDGATTKQGSVGHYLLRGSVGNWRLERAVVEGSVLVFPQADHKESVLTFTNQTLQLVAVRQIQQELTIDYQPQRHSFHFQPHHPQRGQEERPGLEESLTGVHMPQQAIIDAQALAVESIKSIAESIPEGATGDPPLVYHVTRAVEMLSRLTQHEIETVLTKLPRTDIEIHQSMKFILMTLAMSTGTEPSIEYMLNHLQHEPYHPNIAHTFFITAPHIVKNPAFVHRIVDTFLGIPWSGRAANYKWPSFLNLARLVNKLCLRPGNWTNEDACNNHTCDANAVLNSLIPPLTQALQNEEAAEWERLVTIQTLCNLGSPRTISVLRDIILGVTTTTTINMRINAIFCLSAKHMMKMVKFTVMTSLLMPIMQNVAEHPEVRNVAFLTLTTWNPSHGWWLARALSSWHEPSPQVAAFTTSTITYLALGTGPTADKAARVALMSKPAPPASLTHSWFLQDFLHECLGDGSQQLAWLATTRDLFPSHVLLNLQLQLLGRLETTEFVILQQGLQEYLNRRNKYDSKGHSGDVQLVDDIFRQLREDLELSPAKPVTDLLLSLMIDEASVLKLEGNPFEYDWVEAANTFRYKRVKESTTILPTDLGLPVVFKYTEDSATQLTVVPYYALRKPLKGVTSGITLYTNIHHSNAATYDVRTLVPWGSGAALVSGMTSSRAFTARVEVRQTWNPQGSGMLVAVSPYNQDKVKMLDWNNTVYTSLTQLFPSQVNYSGHSDKKVINPPTITERGETLLAAAGLALHYEWQGDADTLRGVIDFFRNKPSQVCTSWRYLLEFDPTNSSTSGAIFNLFVSQTEARANIVEAEGEEDLGQVSQDPDDYDFMSQVSQTSSNAFQEFSQVSGFGQEVESPPWQQEDQGHLARLQQMVSPAQGGTVRTGVVSMELEGHTRTTKYEASLSMAENKDHVTTRVLFSLASYPPLGSFDTYNVTCFDLSVERPVYPLPTLPLRPEHLHISSVLQVHHGATCTSGPPLMTIKASVDGTQEPLDQARADGDLECVNRDQIDLTHSNISLEVETLNFQETSAQRQDYPPLLLSLSHQVDGRLRALFLYHLSSYHHSEPNPTKWAGWRKVVGEPFVMEALYHGLLERVLYGQDHTTCTLTHTQVRTHDGRELTFHPSNCWTTTTIHYPNNDHPPPHVLDFTVQVRFTDQWEVQVAYPWAGIFLEFTNSVIRVNGEAVHGPHEKFHYDTSSAGMLVEITNIITIVVSDSITIKVPAALSRGVKGLCGNFDGEPINDMFGPQDCLYSDPELLAQAWTTWGNGCNRFALRNEKQKVSQYQETCTHTVFQSTGATQANMTADSCTDWEYQDLQRTEWGMQCWGRVLTPVCRPGCSSVKTVNTPVKYQCSSMSHVEEPQCYSLEFPTPVPLYCVHN